MSTIGMVLCGTAAVLLLVGALLLLHLREEDRLALRLLQVQRLADAGPGLPGANSLSGVLRPVAALGAMLARSGLLSMRTLAELQQTLQTAGLRGHTGLSLFVGAKLLLVVIFPFVVSLALHHLQWWPSYWMALLGGAGVAGLLTPDLVVRRRRARYLHALDQGLPDALDMLVICSEAGLALEAAFERVGTEIATSHPVIAQEMRTTLQEMRITADRRAPLMELGRRTGLESLKRLGGTLMQTIQYGTPLSHALRSLSSEMRQEMLIRFEGRAARLPVLLTMPMIVFILPCVFLVVGGPALVQILNTFSK